MGKTQIWIDTDIALGSRRGDVDDGFALAAVLAAPEVEVVGISAVAGNTDAASAADNARALLAAFGRPPGSVPVVSAAEAPARLAALPACTSVLALGPLTHPVAAAALDPEFPRRVEVRAVGSVVNRRRYPMLSFFCLNFRHDPAAGNAFMKLPWRQRRLCPLDVVQRLRCGKHDLERLASLGGPAAYLADGSRRWLRQSPWRYLSRRFPAWDLVAALDAIDRLPGARYETLRSGGDRLVDFDGEAAKEAFFELMAAHGDR